MTSPNGASATKTALTTSEATTFWRITRSGAGGAGDGVGQPGEVVAHQRDVGGLERDVAAGGAHGDADVRRRQRRARR